MIHLHIYCISAFKPCAAHHSSNVFGHSSTRAVHVTQYTRWCSLSHLNHYDLNAVIRVWSF